MSTAAAVAAPPAYEPPADGWRTFLTLWVTQSCSMIGTAVTFFALNIWITQALYPAPAMKHRLALALSANATAFAVPMVAGALVGGVWADRHDRRRIMLMANVANAVVTLTLVTLLARGALTLPLTLALTVVYALAGAMHAASFDTGYALLLRRDQLPRGNGMMQSVWGIAALAAPAIAATLIGVGSARQAGPAAISHGTALAVGVDALTFVVAALVLLRITLPPVPRLPGAIDARPSFRREAAEGIRFVIGHRPLLGLLVAFATANLVFAMLTVLQPLLVKFRLAADAQVHHLGFEAALAWLATVGAAGAVAGGIVVSAWGGLKRQRVYGVLVPMIVSGFMLAAVGLTTRLAVAAAAMFVCESGVPMVNAHSMAIWQSRTPHALQGRVLAVRRVIAQSTFPLGTMIAGPLAAAFDSGTVLVGAGVLFVVTCTFLITQPAMRHIED